MEILFNELSLDGSFVDEEAFLDVFEPMLHLLKIIENNSIVLYREQELYSQNVTPQLTLHDLLKKSDFSRERDWIKRFKISLSRLMQDPPFWNYDQKHSSNDRYECVYTTKTNGYSLAEACERDKIVLSFKSEKFSEASVEISKNGELITIFNAHDPSEFLDFLHESGKIPSDTYLLERYEGTNLSFRHFEKVHGITELESSEKHAFLNTFKMFSEMSWQQISQHDGLQYKPYTPSKFDWFAESEFKNESICKFRASQKYRCFGFRKGEIFYVLRIETDHKHSDHG